MSYADAAGLGREFVILINSFSNALSREVKNRQCLMRGIDDVSVAYYLPFALANVCLHDGFLSFSRAAVPFDKYCAQPIHIWVRLSALEAPR
jgi:hypothetical protein